MKFRDFLKNNIVCLDGGMGTLLQERGLLPGEHPECWSISHPEVIRDIHRTYFDAGSNVVNTNTFGANSLSFSHEELEEIIKCSVENAAAAREASLAEGAKFISLDIGPSGRLLKPYGDFDFEEAVAMFAEVVRLGEKYGADLITIETMNDCYETKAALLAAKENSSLPVIVSNAYSENGLLMTGASPEAMCAMLEGMGADALGVNCSLGPEQLKPVVERLLACSSTPVILKPNAGLPKTRDGKTVFDVSAGEFAESVLEMIDKGVRVAGGCCGTTPEYIRLLAEGIKSRAPKEIAPKNITAVSSYAKAVRFGKDPVLIGERINPTGKKRFKQALLESDIDYILGEGIGQQESGVHILDVNVGISEIDEPQMLERVVFELQSVSDLPLQLDTSDPIAMERAMRIYCGKALINSVNGKAESMAAIFPLVKKYGGAVIALTLDENGIPDTAEGRFAIAEKILKTAAEYGIDRRDIIFDTLAMTVSADSTAAVVTLDALKMIKNRLGCCTSLGVSNISFGLPGRDLINGVFFAAALEAGLNAAIMNPYSAEMMKTYYSYRALTGLDANCGGYIEFMQSYTPAAAAQPSAAKPAPAAAEGKSRLQNAVIRGLKEQAAEATRELLESTAPLDIVKNEIVPSLDIVGKGYEEKRVYLPQLLMSAEAAKLSFEEIKRYMLSHSGEMKPKCAVVIATVHGDIHDIGKNIVRLLLENYGFQVTDLGKDVPPEAIADEVVRLHAPIAGLSALMTTTVPAMEETIRQLRKCAPWCKIVVGGAVLTKEYAAAIGADKYAGDAMEAVRYAEEVDCGLEQIEK